MGRLLIFLYGLAAYVIFLGTFVYAMGFMSGFVVPRAIDDGTVGPLLPSILVNAGLLGLFAVQHCIMARPGFKVRWTRIIPAAAERSTFVLVTCVILVLTFWLWQPLPAVVWDVQAPLWRGAILGIAAIGWSIVLYSTLLIDHFDLFGMRQVTLHLRGLEYTPIPFMERSLYRFVQHPLMLGFFIAFWATPTMTVGHLMFAGIVTAWVTIQVRIEENDLGKALGGAYAEYQSRTPRFLPFGRRKSAAVALDATAS